MFFLNIYILPSRACHETHSSEYKRADVTLMCTKSYKFTVTKYGLLYFREQDLPRVKMCQAFQADVNMTCFFFLFMLRKYTFQVRFPTVFL